MKRKPKMEWTSVVGYFEACEDSDVFLLTTNDEDMAATGNLAGIQVPRPGLKEYVVTGLVQRFKEGTVIDVESIVVATFKQQLDAAMDQIRELLNQNEQSASFSDLIEDLLVDVQSPDELAAAIPFVFDVQGYAWTQWDHPQMFLGSLGYCYKEWKTGGYAFDKPKKQIELSP